MYGHAIRRAMSVTSAMEQALKLVPEGATIISHSSCVDLGQGIMDTPWYTISIIYEVTE